MGVDYGGGVGGDIIGYRPGYKINLFPYKINLFHDVFPYKINMFQCIFPYKLILFLKKSSTDPLEAVTFRLMTQ